MSSRVFVAPFFWSRRVPEPGQKRGEFGTVYEVEPVQSWYEYLTFAQTQKFALKVPKDRNGGPRGLWGPKEGELDERMVGCRTGYCLLDLLVCLSARERSVLFIFFSGVESFSWSLFLILLCVRFHRQEGWQTPWQLATAATS